jgi:hypothetical protein
MSLLKNIRQVGRNKILFSFFISLINTSGKSKPSSCKSNINHNENFSGNLFYLFLYAAYNPNLIQN